MATDEVTTEDAEIAKYKKKKKLSVRGGSARLQITYTACSEASPHEIVWLNEGSGLLHPLNSRWDGKTLIGRYVQLGEALANGCLCAPQ